MEVSFTFSIFQSPTFLVPWKEIRRFLPELSMPMLLNNTMPAVQFLEKGWEKYIQKKKKSGKFSLYVSLLQSLTFTSKYACFRILK